MADSKNIWAATLHADGGSFYRAVLGTSLPTDPLAGFLPPNDETGRGEGHVSFTIRPRADVQAGTVVTNIASIVFDTNEPILTNQVWNTIGRSNNPPDAVDDSASLDEDAWLDIPVLENDYDPDGDALSVTDYSQPISGTAALNPDDTILYTPSADYCGIFRRNT